MRISDWSSDVCSSDLLGAVRHGEELLLDDAEAKDRDDEQPADHEHEGLLARNDRADEPAPPLVVGAAVDMVVAALDLADLVQQLADHIGREDDRTDPGYQKRTQHTHKKYTGTTPAPPREK